MPEGTAPCVVKDGEVAVGEDGLNCDVEQGATLRILGEGTAPADAPSKDEPAQEPSPPEPPPVETSPPPKAAASSRPTPKVKPMEPEEVEVAAEAVEEAEAVATEKPAKPAKSKGFHEEVGTPDAGVADLSQFTALAGDNGGLAVILSLIAVVGGGAAWKFYSQSSSQKHELEMAKLEKGQNDHAACEAKRMELSARLDALERKFTGAIDLDAPSTTDLEKKIKNLERRLREVKSTKT
jgi:hypothetical protein